MRRNTSNAAVSHCLQGSITSLCVAAGRGWKGWSCTSHCCNYWCCWMNVFLSAVQSCILREKNPNPNLLRNHLRHEMQRKINDRNEYSAVSQTEDRAWFSCTKMQAQMCTRGLWDPPSAQRVHNTPVTSLSAECARHCQRAGEALACVTCTLSSYLQDRFSLFSFGQVNPSLLGMKIILQTSLVFLPLLLKIVCFRSEESWNVLFFEGNSLTPVSFLHE